MALRPGIVFGPAYALLRLVIVALACVVLNSPRSRAEETNTEFVVTDKTMTYFLNQGYDIRGTWGSRVLVLEKGTSVVMCEIVLKGDLFGTSERGCEMTRATPAGK